MDIKLAKNRIFQCLILILISYYQPLYAKKNSPHYENIKQDSLKYQNLEYQQAAKYSHLSWSEVSSEKVTLELSALKNFSGIPIEQREEKPKYYYHGKLPKIMDSIYQDAFLSSRFFSLVNQNADYKIELTLDHYKLPFNYDPEDQWWNKLYIKADRWLQKPPNTGIKLTLKMSSGKKPIKTWIKSVSMAMSNCDLNKHPQPQSYLANKNQVIRNYLSTTPGQTFLAATNFLILKAIQHIHQQPGLAKVEKVIGNQIHLYSPLLTFTNGEFLPVFYQDDKQVKSLFSTGQVEVIKAMQNHAIAYPINLRSDHIRVGDWIEMKDFPEYSNPISVFIAAKQCAPVITATLQE